MAFLATAGYWTSSPAIATLTGLPAGLRTHSSEEAGGDGSRGEAWHRGKAKGREDRMVIRARVLSAKNLLEFFVASSSTLMLTGMLVELKTDLNKELDSRNVRMGMKQVTSQKDVDALGAMKTLFEKASGSEIDAGEMEA